uniref:Programmed cell death protein 10 n=1 Tax=Acrobeloides nanus TaxID=290746 RepID=A0A914DTL3_9BILA
MNEEGGYLGAMTYQCLFSASLERLRKVHGDNPQAINSISNLQMLLHQADRSSPSFLFDFAKILLADSKLNVNLQESFLRMHATAPIDDLEISNADNVPEFQELSTRAIALRKVLARVPDEMADRRPFLETIKEIASSIKKLLDATNAILQIVPQHVQSLIEKRKREFVHYSKRFSNTLKEYFRDQNATQVFISANQLIFQATQIVRAVREKVVLQ